MAQRPLYETQAKALIDAHYPARGGKPVIRFAEIGPETDLPTLLKELPWLKKGKIVVKVDELFGKRKKLGYVKVAKNWSEAKKWMEGLRGKEITVGARTGNVAHFIVEPFIAHEIEYYLVFNAERDSDVILFSKEGGVDVEEGKTPPIRIEVPLATQRGQDLSLKDAIPKILIPTVEGLFVLWKNLDMAFLEINPVTVVDGNVYLLDAVCRVDTCAMHRQHHTWGTFDISEGFGTTVTPEERNIRELDAKTGASLKFVLLNPKGRIWTMVAGGGASIVYADAITKRAPKELANYGEWSGNPTADEMEAYTANILELMTKGKGKQVLIVGGGIANFTDVEVTFAGVIRALRKYGSRMENIRIYVRRAGPNDQTGLKALKDACVELGIWCSVHGAEMPMTEVVSMAMKDLGIRVRE